MGKLVILKVERGDFETGYEVTLKIGEDGDRPSTEISGKLPTAVPVAKGYRAWRIEYKNLDAQMRGRAGGAKAGGNPREVLAKCYQASEEFRRILNQWLGTELRDFQRLKEKFLEKCPERQEPIRVLIQTNDPFLRKLPWHEWDLFTDVYTNADVALSSPEFDQVQLAPLGKRKSKVRILAILGNSEGIDIQGDRKFLQSLPGADVIFLAEKSRKDLTFHLWNEKFEILFFAGHSSSADDKGCIYINKTESLTISDLKRGLKKAIENGLQVAIFNSCDGLNLARDLGDLHIPHIIVMREPVPDKVAQEFLKLFLTAFAKERKPLYLAVREAREKLRDQGLDNEVPGSTWLPVVFGQNPTEVPPTWQELGGFKDKSVLERRVALVLGTLVVAAFIFFFYQTPTDRNALSVIRFLIALTAGFSVSFLLSSFNLGNYGRLSLIPVKAISGFLTVVSVFVASLYALPGEAVILRNLTGINEYPTLGLLQDTFPQPLSEVLNVNETPIIDTQNPVYQSIQRFRDQIGNKKTISEIYGGFDVGVTGIDSYVSDNDNNTHISFIPNQKEGFKKGELKPINQSNFSEKDPLKYKEEVETLEYTTAWATFKNSLEEASWTAIIKKNNSSINFIQYPRLSDFSWFSHISETNTDNTWFKNIANANPDLRGFLESVNRFYFDYEIENSLEFINNSLGYCFTLVDINIPTPYVRFLDIKNNGFTSLKVDSLQHKIFDQPAYQITVVDDRNSLFQGLPDVTDDWGISIPPGQHIFIPIEFGFDRGTIQNNQEHHYNPTSIDSAKLAELSESTLYFANAYDINFVNESLKNNIAKTDEIFQRVFNPVELDQQFLLETKEYQELLDSLPRRFAVGPLMNVTSIRIDGKDYPTDNPLSNPRFSMSVHFQYGSCPYLVIYDAEKGYWIERGTVLTDRRSKSLQHDEVYYLGDNTTKFKIEEREREITYIDSLSILYTDPVTNETQEVKPDIAQLIKVDDDYFILHQGESLDINLRTLIPNNATNVRMKINGYYEVLDPM